MADKLTILHLVPSSASGGASINVCRFIEKSSYRYIIVIQKDDEKNYAALKNYAQEIYDLPMRKIGLKTILGILAIIRHHHIDVIHSHGKGSGFYGRIIGKLMNIPSVHTFRGYHNPYRGFKARSYLALERILGKWTKVAIAVSLSEKEKILSDGIIAPKKVSTLPNPIFLASNEKTLNLLQYQGENIVYIARISPQKDILTLLKVAQCLKGICTIHVFGGTNSSDVNYAYEVKKEMENNHIDNVVLHGDVPNASGLIKQFSLYVSTARWEGLPTAVAEAMLSGIPVVGTDCTGNIDLIRNRETGLLCSTGNHEEIAAAILKLLHDSTLRKQLTVEALAFTQKMFDIPSIVKRQEEIYRSVISCEALL